MHFIAIVGAMDSSRRLDITLLLIIINKYASLRYACVNSFFNGFVQGQHQDVVSVTKQTHLYRMCLVFPC